MTIVLCILSTSMILLLIACLIGQKLRAMSEIYPLINEQPDCLKHGVDIPSFSSDAPQAIPNMAAFFATSCNPQPNTGKG